MGEFDFIIKSIKRFPNLEAALKAAPELGELIKTIPGLEKYLLESDEFWHYTVMPEKEKIRKAILDGTAKNYGKAVPRVNGRIAEFMRIIETANKEAVADVGSNTINPINPSSATTDTVSNSINPVKPSSAASVATGFAVSVSTISVIVAVAIGVCYLNYKLNKATDKNSAELKREFLKINEKLDDIKKGQWNHDIYGPFKKTLEKLQVALVIFLKMQYNQNDECRDSKH